jgi:hypothetical protein
MNAAELRRRSEKGRHSRNGVVLVIFKKKFWQPTVEKLFPSEVSNGCGKGEGRTGGEAGTVGRLFDVAVGVEELLVEVLGEEEVGKLIPEVVDDAAWGSGLRL